MSVKLDFILEILVDLRESILTIARHFQNMDPKSAASALHADYSMNRHAQDHEVFASTARGKRRRAKALLGR